MYCKEKDSVVYYFAVVYSENLIFLLFLASFVQMTLIRILCFLFAFLARHAEHVHPSLVSAADNTEYCIHRILYAVELTIARNGKNLQTREIQLMRISDAATWTYAMVSALARASR